MNAILPDFFSVKPCGNMVRLGKDFDGGYLLCREDVSKSDFLVGMGLSADWSFEQDFFSFNPNIEIRAYDASVSERFFFRCVLKSLFRLYDYKNVINWISILFSYRKFFSQPNITHIKKFVGVDCDEDLFCTVSEIMDNTDCEDVFLKIDIEGSEYRILDDIIKYQDRISGLVIEFHDCDLHLDRIKYFMANFAFKLIHVHANNFVPVDSKSGLPLVLELSFSKYSTTDAVLELPHRLDMPNNPNSDEIRLSV